MHFLFRQLGRGQYVILRVKNGKIMVWFSLVVFYGISNFVSYLMSKSCLYIHIIYTIYKRIVNRYQYLKRGRAHFDLIRICLRYIYIYIYITHLLIYKTKPTVLCTIKYTDCFSADRVRLLQQVSCI